MSHKLPRPQWRSTSFLISPALEKPLRLFLAEKNLTLTKLFNSMVLALCKGDIQVDEQSISSNRMNITTESDLSELLGVTFRDTDGNALLAQNPNEVDLSII